MILCGSSYAAYAVASSEPRYARRIGRSRTKPMWKISDRLSDPPEKRNGATGVSRNNRTVSRHGPRFTRVEMACRDVHQSEPSHFTASRGERACGVGRKGGATAAPE